MLQRQRSFGNESFAMHLRFPYGISTKRFTTNFKGNEKQLKNSGKFMTWLEDYFQCSLVSFPVKRNSKIFEPLQKFILEFYQHGHLAFSETKWLPSMSGADEEDEPQVLTMKMLTAGFIIWLVCVMICTTVFILEIIFGGLKRREKS